jgi:hypothetical protein
MQPGPRPLRVSVRPTVAELLADADVREPWKTADSLSGSHFERVTIHGEHFVVKYVCVDDDWILRATGDLHCRQLELFGSTLLHRLPEEIDHAVVACAPFTSLRGRRGAALLMREVGSWLVPPGSTPIPLEAQRLFIAHMASMHATYWGFRDDLDLFPLAHHYVFLTPTMARLELAAGGHDPVPLAVAAGWRELAARHPAEARLLGGLADDPSPLLAALGRGPTTLIHGDWKLGNLGGHPDGRTILLDWDRCGAGPPLVDLAWYLAVNCDRLPEAKEATIARYRAALEGSGISTSDWWDEQLAAALVGAFLQLGWSKTADRSEFEWWAERAAESGWLR